MKYRIFFAAGPGDVIHAHKYWMRGEHDPSEVSIAYSSQFMDFCREIKAEAYVVASNPQRQFFHDGPYVLEHRPKPTLTSGIRFHFQDIAYAFGLLRTALKFRANWAILHSGSAQYYAMILFRLAGIRVIVSLHNTVWPSGFPPKRFLNKVVRWLDAIFFRWGATAVVAVGPECLRQVHQITRGRQTALYLFLPQYRCDVLDSVSPPSPYDKKPMRVLFLGRIDGEKGSFNILEMAEKVEAVAPGRVLWDICGSGSAFANLQEKHRRMNLQSIVTLHGWTSLEKQIEIRAQSHVTIVPTPKTFPEGLAKTAVESILIGRPVITNKVVPALEVLRPACLEAEPENIESYTNAILRLLSDPGLYRKLCDATYDLRPQFFDGKLSFNNALMGIVGDEQSMYPKWTDESAYHRSLQIN